MTEQKVTVRVGRAADVPPGEGRQVRVGGRVLAVFHTADGFFVIDNACPHQQGPLGDGLVAGGKVYCPLHNWAVEIGTGKVCEGGHGQVEIWEVEHYGEDLFITVNKSEFGL